VNPFHIRFHTICLFTPETPLPVLPSFHIDALATTQKPEIHKLKSLAGRAHLRSFPSEKLLLLLASIRPLDMAVTG
jgi:hypothetical protein